MSEVYDLTCYASLMLPESNLSQSNHAYHSFVAKLCHHRGKNTAALKNRSSRVLTHTEITESTEIDFKDNLDVN